MSRAKRLALIAAGIVVVLAILIWSAPMQARNAEYCHGKGGIYNYKSMQCFHDGSMENMIGKNL